MCSAEVLERSHAGDDLFRGGAFKEKPCRKDIFSGAAFEDQACGPAKMSISHREERNIMLKQAFRVGKSAPDGHWEATGPIETSVSRRRERAGRPRGRPKDRFA